MQLVEPHVSLFHTGPQQAVRPRGGGGGLRRAAGEGGRRAGPDGRLDRQHPRRAGDRREGRQDADPGVRLARGAAGARRRDHPQGLPRGAPRARRAGPAVEGAVDHPHRPARSPSIPRPCATTRPTSTPCASSSPSWSSSPWSRSSRPTELAKRRGPAARRGGHRSPGAGRSGPRPSRMGEPARSSSPCSARSGRSASRSAARPEDDPRPLRRLPPRRAARRRPWRASWTAGSAIPEVRLSGHNLKEVLRLCPGGPVCQPRLFDAMLVSYLLKPSVHGHTPRRAGARAAEPQGRSRPRRRAGTGARSRRVGDSRLAAYAGERVALARAHGRGDAPRAGRGPLARSTRRSRCRSSPCSCGMEEAGILLDVRLPAGRCRPSWAGSWPSSRRRSTSRPARASTSTRRSSSAPSSSRSWSYPSSSGPRRPRATRPAPRRWRSWRPAAIPIAELLLRYRELTKLKSTYVDALPALVGPDGRVHTRFNQAVAATGRLSSINPNLQNIPDPHRAGAAHPQRLHRAARGTCCWSPTTARSSCASWRTSPTSRR